MKLRPRLTLEVATIALLVLCIAMCVLIALVQPTLLLVLVPILLAILLALGLFGWRIRRSISNYLTTTVFEGSNLQVGLTNLPMPAVLMSGKTLVWYNPAFRNLLGGKDFLLQPISRILPGLDLAQCATPDGQNMFCYGRRYSVYAAQTNGKEEMTLLYLYDNTDLKDIAQEYMESRPVCMEIEIDGYQEIMANLLDSEKSRLLEALNRTLEGYIGRTTGFLRRVSSSRYIAVVEERHLEKMQETRFDLLDKVRQLDDTRTMTLSIGVGHNGESVADCQKMARQSLDMAVGRGGDQVAVKNPDGFTFYGGVSRSVEKRSRVKSRVQATALANLVQEADSVLIIGHKASDLDCVGSAVGVLRICKMLDVPAAIVVRKESSLAENLIDRLMQNGYADDFITPNEALGGITDKTLLVVVDTYLKHLVEETEVLNRCQKVAVIDHHRKAVNHIEDPLFLCHEPYASSASELISEILQYVPDAKLTAMEAEALLAGIMLDTRNFSLHTGVRTFEAAAYLRRCGAATEEVKLLFSTSMQEYAAKASLVENAQLYKNCAVSIWGELPPDTGVAVPQAANELLGIEGVDASFVGTQKGDDVSISARSMGKINVQVIMEMLGGGGHLTMAATRMKNTTPEQAHTMLCAAIDEYWAHQKVLAETATH